MRSKCHRPDGGGRVEGATKINMDCLLCASTPRSKCRHTQHLTRCGLVRASRFQRRDSRALEFPSLPTVDRTCCLVLLIGLLTPSQHLNRVVWEVTSAVTLFVTRAWLDGLPVSLIQHSQRDFCPHHVLWEHLMRQTSSVRRGTAHYDYMR